MRRLIALALVVCAAAWLAAGCKRAEKKVEVTKVEAQADPSLNPAAGEQVMREAPGPSAEDTHKEH